MASSNQYSSTQYKDDIQYLIDTKLDDMLTYIKTNTTYTSATGINVTFDDTQKKNVFVLNDGNGNTVDVSDLGDPTFTGLIDEYNTLDKRYKGTSQAYDVMFQNQTFSY